MPENRLFTPFAIRDVTLPNRVMVSPMCTYSASDGWPTAYHLVHLGRFALGGAGLVVVEATAIEPRGRISSGDLGIWDDDHGEALRPIAGFLRRSGAVPGIQLGHAGRKASVQAPWDGNGPLGPGDRARGDAPWPVVGPSAISAGDGWPVPEELSATAIEELIEVWAQAARRAAAAGFEIIELHGAHGYLLHSFLSPVSNTRADEWGGDAERRMAFPLRVVERVRAAVPKGVGLFYRLSAIDGASGGIGIEETSEFARRIVAAGVDVVDVSSGGASADRSQDQRIRRGFAFHSPYSAAIREAADVPVVGVGFIVQGEQAEKMIERGDADIVAVGREFLADPNWAHHARHALQGITFEAWHQQAGWWLDKRQPVLERLASDGETPMSRYAMNAEAATGEAGSANAMSEA